MKAEGMDIEHAEGEMNQGDVTPVDGADICKLRSEMIILRMPYLLPDLYAVLGIMK